MKEQCKTEELIITVKKLINGGEGFGYTTNNETVFVSDVCAGDLIRCDVVKRTQNYINADLTEIIEPSNNRIKPSCPYANVCGGCQWQHIEYKEQLYQKRNIVKETLSKIAGLNIDVPEVISTGKKFNYRQKIQMPVQQTKKSKRFLIGFYKKKSHDIVNIKYCPVQPEYFNEIIEYIRVEAQLSGIKAYDEKRHDGELRHIVFRDSSSDNNCTLIFVINTNTPSKGLLHLAKKVFNKFEKIKGVVLNYNDKKNNEILSENFHCIEGEDFIIQKMNDLTFKISAGSFFQINPEAAELMLNTVKNFIETNITEPTVLDAYCGVGSFGLWLKDIAKEIYAVEQSSSSVKDAKENVLLNKANNFHIIEGDVKEIFNTFEKEGKKFDVVIIDPPRKGCDIKALEQLISLTNKFLIYVSCNPATLARDLKILCQNGFILKKIQPVDMFCHTFHVETVVLMAKEN